MTKQNFISMSLESGLKYVDILCEQDDNICTLKGILNGLYCDEHGNVDCEINDCMPILRPLDLTKEIEHGGEKFVPIVELAKIAWVDDDVDFKYQSLKEGTVFITFSDKNNVFGYDSNTQSFFGAIDGKPCSVVNQLTLFETMVKYHFDISNLISKNQAIDINTLETNPYK